MCWKGGLHFIKVMAKSFHSMVFLDFEKFVSCISMPTSGAIDVISLYQRLLLIFFFSVKFPWNLIFIMKLPTSLWISIHCWEMWTSLMNFLLIIYHLRGTVYPFRKLPQLFQYFLLMVGNKYPHHSTALQHIFSNKISYW